MLGAHGTLHARASLGRMSKAKVSAGHDSPEALYTVEADMGAGPGSLRGTHRGYAGRTTEVDASPNDPQGSAYRGHPGRIAEARWV